ncbi:MAG TPA: hypothetical protein PLK12_04870 [Prolixibacteraceae bacterium]|nr:hypothetical protein [Prolixibacteraceae bacterium]
MNKPERIIPKNNSERNRFILKYSLRGLLSLTLLFALIVLFKELYFDHDPEYWIDKFYNNSLVIHLVYVGSEVFFGLFPPEIFMFWAIHTGDSLVYFLNILFFTGVSLGAGHLAFWGGRYLAHILGTRIHQQKMVVKYFPVFKKFGGLLIIIAALTPLPWATISLVIGAVGYSYKRFSLFALSRIVRFVLNGFLIYQTGNLLF